MKKNMREVSCFILQLPRRPSFKSRIKKGGCLKARSEEKLQVSEIGNQVKYGELYRCLLRIIPVKHILKVSSSMY